jgi:hypothetical protein
MARVWPVLYRSTEALGRVTTKAALMGDSKEATRTEMGGREVRITAEEDVSKASAAARVDREGLVAFARLRPPSALRL